MPPIPPPSVVERDAGRQYDVRVVGRLPDVHERFYAISAERRFKPRRRRHLVGGEERPLRVIANRAGWNGSRMP